MTAKEDWLMLTTEGGIDVDTRLKRAIDLAMCLEYAANGGIIAAERGNKIICSVAWMIQTDIRVALDCMEEQAAELRRR